MMKHIAWVDELLENIKIVIGIGILSKIVIKEGIILFFLILCCKLWLFYSVYNN